ncbi:hypothetical protein [Oribacterium sp. WCC10]|uniref:hypothetical protein n=1 Tax=Oribacterium sp. WCC10 TaxID=1855343 RepID=UPI0008E627E0|nr:hypothetical protein [Oribacterium sp. WCC10]SFG68745.1 Glutaredoxin-related protein [Oribacterium sp. WCC10]
MIKVYGRDDCIDCINFKKSLDATDIEYDFRDIGKSLHDMAVFLKIRDTNDAFTDIKGTGKIGIPVIITENKEAILDWENFLINEGYNVIKNGQTCSIDGKGC